MQRVYELLCGDTTSTHSSTSKMLHYSPLSVSTPQRYSPKTPKIFFKRKNTFIFSLSPTFCKLFRFMYHSLIFSFTPFRHHDILFTPLGLLRSHFPFHPSFFILESFYPLVRKSSPCPKTCPHGGQARTFKIFHPFSITHPFLSLSHPALYHQPFYPLFPLK